MMGHRQRFEERDGLSFTRPFFFLFIAQHKREGRIARPTTRIRRAES